MKNPLISAFKSRIKSTAKPYQPKFAVGDYIINMWDGRRIVSEVLEVKLFTEEHYKMYEPQPADEYWSNPKPVQAVVMSAEQRWGMDVGEYTLLDVVNDHSNNMNSGKPARRRMRSIQKIDAKYKKVDAKTAQILYGKKV